jgi:hypothetical protein
MSRLTFRLVAFALGLMALMPLQPLYSQASKGSISGEVHDPSGSLIPNAGIKLVEVRTNQAYGGKNR